MISFINAMTYVMHYKDYSQRVTISTGTLSALVLNHVALANQLPSSTTNTLADCKLFRLPAVSVSKWGTERLCEWTVPIL